MLGVLPGEAEAGLGDVLAQVVPLIAEGIRGSLRFDAARRVSGAEAPGLIVLDGTGATKSVDYTLNGNVLSR